MPAKHSAKTRQPTRRSGRPAESVKAATASADVAPPGASTATDAVPTDAVPTDAVPTDALPSGAPTLDAPASVVEPVPLNRAERRARGKAGQQAQPYGKGKVAGQKGPVSGHRLWSNRRAGG